ncbi:MAG: RNA polymerase sigma factor [Dehalococcoidia bacterium]
MRALVERYDWTLLKENELVELVLGSTQPGASQADLVRLTKHHYTIALYEACRQAEDLDRQERGYHELFRFLFRAAYNRWPELAEDATQRALVLIYEQIDRCRTPATFLRFALYKLQHAFKQEHRARGQELFVSELDQVRVGDRAASHARLNQEDRLKVLIDAITRLPDQRQQKAILLKFFGGLSDDVISARLQETVVNVRVLRHRGIVQLRKDERLREYFDGPNG